MSQYRGVEHTPGTHRRVGKRDCPACRLRARDYRNERAALLRRLRGGRTLYSQCRDPEPDWVAVQRVIDGDRRALTIAERREAVRILRARGLTYLQVAVQLGITDRAVARHVAKLKQQGVAA